MIKDNRLISTKRDQDRNSDLDWPLKLVAAEQDQ